MKNVQKIIGYILLFPPILSVLLFTVNLLVKDSADIFKLTNLSPEWTGSFGSEGGYMSATPVYFGLMAIAGVYLIVNAKE